VNKQGADAAPMTPAFEGAKENTAPTPGVLTQELQVMPDAASQT
jgi:hypothetical protein